RSHITHPVRPWLPCRTCDRDLLRNCSHSRPCGALCGCLLKECAGRPTASVDTSDRPRPQPLPASRRWYDDWPEAGGDIGVAVEGSVVSSTVSGDRKSTRLNSSHVSISYAVFCLKKKK